MAEAPLYVIAPLSVPAADRAWIDAVRRAHDPQVGLVEAHVTFVFGVRTVGLGAMIEHAAETAAATAPVDFHLDRAQAVRNHTGTASHVFLVPSAGEAAMRGLHRRLHAGPLESELRADIPYIPHVTVAAMADHAAAERLAGEIAGGGLSILGRLERLDVVGFDGARLELLWSAPLAG